jgi:ribosomally synthesized peptide (two-chain TOMM family)
MVMDKFMEFRTAYLRLIALAWADPDGFGKTLLGSSKATDTINLMMQHLNFEWPWPKACRLWFAESTSFRFDENQSGWTFPSGFSDFLTLYMPLSPKSVDVNNTTADPLSTDPDIPSEDRTKALAELYRERSAFFAEDWGKDWIIRGGIDSTSRPQAIIPKENPFLRIREAWQELTGGFWPAGQEFPALQVALLAATAMAWDNTQIIRTPSITILVPVPTPEPVLLIPESPIPNFTVAPTISIAPEPIPGPMTSPSPTGVITSQTPPGRALIITITIPGMAPIVTKVSTTAAPTTISLPAALSTTITITDFKSLLTTDARTALSLIRGYKLPWAMTLNIADDTDARWDSQRSRWIYSRTNELMLYLPSKPQAPQYEPVALAMYNGTGAAYPFSCTC